MDVTEKYTAWGVDSAGSLPFHSPYSTSTDDLPLHLLYGLNRAGAGHNVNLEPVFTSQVISPLTLTTELDSDFQIHSLDLSNDKSQSPESDIVSPTLSEGRGSISENSNSKRRIQNRAAQRRFRDRREGVNKSLREKAAELEERYQALEEKFNQKSEEVSQLQSDIAGSKLEINSLRQRWRTMVLLLQRPKSLHFLSVLVGGEQTGTSASTASPHESTGLPVDESTLDGYLRCLDALILPDKS
ncbi:hypothetical protein BJX70DRAFT_209423 [Aspergillus crustosus]